MVRVAPLAVALACATVLAACAAETENRVARQGDDAPGGSTGSTQAGAPKGPPPDDFPCTGYPAKGTPTPADLPLPTAAIDGTGDFVTGSVTGPTSYFGGPIGDSPGPFALTQQWQPDGWKSVEPNGHEIGNQPCNDNRGGPWRSYYAAMRFSKEQFSDPITAYMTYWPWAQEDKYKHWNGAPLVPQMAQPLSYLYGRLLKVTRELDGKTYTVLVRANDRGPAEAEATYRMKPIDLSPWAMGALSGKSECLDWDGTNTGKLAEKCDWTGDGAANKVTVSWADNVNGKPGPI